jgi:ketosteroid isomerase-like protein
MWSVNGVREGKVVSGQTFLERSAAPRRRGAAGEGDVAGGRGVVRESWEAWFRGDLEGVIAAYAEDVAWDLTHFGLRQW